MQRIPVAEPYLGGNEKAYVLDALERAWISGSGSYVDRFEEQFAAFCDVPYAVAVFNGTVALHLAMIVLGIGPGDEVIVPDLTYIASANAVRYVNATPVFADVDPVTWTLDPADVARKISPRTKAIMPVHLYGHPADMDPLAALASAHGLHIIEDAAEAHGAEYKGRRVGGIGTLATFSFFGNKIITTGEGGMLVTHDQGLADAIRLYKGQGMDPRRRYWFPVIGYNYRMTNLQAAIGVAQMERIDWLIERRLEIAAWYSEFLAESGMLLPAQAEWARNVYWLFAPCVPEGVDRDRLMQRMAEDGVETRPFFYPMHAMPPYLEADGDARFPTTTTLSARGINLPSSASLTREQVRYVADSALRALDAL
jgi:perosamine synthetase